jgi:pimeloyl-ACP methyl ester carboxylesterase
VIAADLRGHGRSSAPAEGYTPRDFAADLAELLGRLGVSRVVVAGHSLGGSIAVAMAVEYPGLIRGIVPVDSAYGMDPATMGPLAETLLPALAGPDGHAAAMGLFSTFYTAASPEHLQEWHRRRMLGVPGHVLHGVIAGLVTAPDQFSLRPESDAYLGRVACPALAFRAGRQDPAAVAAWERSCLRHPYSRAIAWEGNGHWLHQERPAEFNALLVEWLANLQA